MGVPWGFLILDCNQLAGQASIILQPIHNFVQNEVQNMQQQGKYV